MGGQIQAFGPKRATGGGRVETNQDGPFLPRRASSVCRGTSSSTSQPHRPPTSSGPCSDLSCPGTSARPSFCADQGSAIRAQLRPGPRRRSRRRCAGAWTWTGQREKGGKRGGGVEREKQMRGLETCRKSIPVDLVHGILLLPVGPIRSTRHAALAPCEAMDVQCRNTCVGKGDGENASSRIEEAKRLSSKPSIRATRRAAASLLRMLPSGARARAL